MTANTTNVKFVDWRETAVDCGHAVADYQFRHFGDDEADDRMLNVLLDCAGDGLRAYMLHRGIEPSIIESTLDAMESACVGRVMALARADMGQAGHA